MLGHFVPIDDFSLLWLQVDVVLLICYIHDVHVYGKVAAEFYYASEMI